MPQIHGGNQILPGTITADRAAPGEIFPSAWEDSALGPTGYLYPAEGAAKAVVIGSAAPPAYGELLHVEGDFLVSTGLIRSTVPDGPTAGFTLITQALNYPAIAWSLMNDATELAHVEARGRAYFRQQVSIGEWGTTSDPFHVLYDNGWPDVSYLDFGFYGFSVSNQQGGGLSFDRAANLWVSGDDINSPTVNIVASTAGSHGVTPEQIVSLGFWVQPVAVPVEMRGEVLYAGENAVGDEYFGVLNVSADYLYLASINNKPIAFGTNDTLRAELLAGGNWDFHAHQLKALADPTDPQDAVTLSYAGGAYQPLGSYEPALPSGTDGQWLQLVSGSPAWANLPGALPGGTDGQWLQLVLGAPSWQTLPADSDRYVKVSGGDTTPDYLFAKLVAGTNITLTKNNAGANETITIDAASGGTNYWSRSGGVLSPLTSSDQVSAQDFHVAATSGYADLHRDGSNDAPRLDLVYGNNYVEPKITITSYDDLVSPTRWAQVVTGAKWSDGGGSYRWGRLTLFQYDAGYNSTLELEAINDPTTHSFNRIKSSSGSSDVPLTIQQDGTDAWQFVPAVSYNQPVGSFQPMTDGGAWIGCDTVRPKRVYAKQGFYFRALGTLATPTKTVGLVDVGTDQLALYTNGTLLIKDGTTASAYDTNLLELNYASHYLRPTTDNYLDFGDSTHEFRTLYLGTSIHLDVDYSYPSSATGTTHSKWELYQAAEGYGGANEAHMRLGITSQTTPESGSGNLHLLSGGGDWVLRTTDVLASQSDAGAWMPGADDAHDLGAGALAYAARRVRHAYLSGYISVGDNLDTGSATYPNNVPVGALGLDANSRLRAVTYSPGGGTAPTTSQVQLKTDFIGEAKTGSSTTTVDIATYTPADPSGGVMTVTYVGFDPTNNDVGRFIRRYVYRRNGATTTIVATETVGADYTTDAPGWAGPSAPTSSSGTLTFHVVGENAKTIHWRCHGVVSEAS